MQWEMMVVALALQALVMLVFSAGYAGVVWHHMARDTAPDAARFLQQTEHAYVAPHVMLRWSQEVFKNNVLHYSYIKVLQQTLLINRRIKSLCPVNNPIIACRMCCLALVCCTTLSPTPCFRVDDPQALGPTWQPGVVEQQGEVIRMLEQQKQALYAQVLTLQGVAERYVKCAF